jgi:hypothetical protein
MAEPHVISALRAKRAELSGDLIAAQKRLEKIRDDLDAVDRTLRVFDPRQRKVGGNMKTLLLYVREDSGRIKSAALKSYLYH